LLERLRSAGVIIRAQDSRLVIEAPAGVITPDLRDVLVRNKANLLSVLGRQQKGGSGDAIDHAVRGVAELLARAYERLNTAPPGGTRSLRIERRPEQLAERKQILDGLAWLDKESKKRFRKDFAGLSDEQQRAICDDLCSASKAKPEFQSAARFFSKFRNLTAGGFYTSPQGFKDLQYVGNIALLSFDGPPPEVLAHLGL
jgi:hypothetical protein